MDRVHLCALNILEKVGVQFDAGFALDALGKYGAHVDFKAQRVKFPAEMTEDFLRGMTGTKTWWYDLTKDKVIEQDGKLFSMVSRLPDVLRGRTYRWRVETEIAYPCVGNGASPWILDFRSGRKREAVLKDVKETAIVGEVLEEVRGFEMTPVRPTDYPLRSSVFHGMVEVLRNSSKPVKLSPALVWDIPMAEYQLKVGEILADDEEEAKRLCGVAAWITSPLRWSSHSLEMLKFGVERELRVDAGTETLAGVAAPITRAGATAQALAECWAGGMFVRALDPEADLHIGFSVVMSDMRSGHECNSCFETILAQVGAAQMCEEYYGVGVSSSVFGLFTESKEPDIQAGYEKTMSCLLSILSGYPSIGLMGALESARVISLEQLVIDNELVKIFKQMPQGICVDDETLAFEAIDRVGPGGTFLTDRHTLRNYRREFLPLELTDRGFWNGDPRELNTMRKKARGKVATILRRGAGNPSLSRDKTRALERLLKEIDKAFGTDGKGTPANV